MKKMVSMLLAAAMLVSLAACQTSGETPAATDPAAQTSANQAPETQAPETQAPETSAAAVPETPAGGGAADESQAASESGAAAESQAESESGAAAESGAASGQTADDLAARNAAAMEEYAPEIITLESGIQIQRIPSDPYLWNTAILKADERGCTACHTLEDAVQNLPLSHPELWNPYDVEMNVNFCYMCHSMALFVQDSMHSLHLSNPNFNGSCESCHYVSAATGEYELWDRAKYDVMMGISAVADVEGDFSFTQDSITPTDELFFYWENGDHRDITPEYDDDPAIFDAWTIQVSGLVDNELTLSLPELAAGNTVTRVMKQICQTNPPAGSYTANCEVTGILLSDVLEMAGVQADANTIRVVSDDGWTYPMPMSYLDEEEPILVTHVNGEPILPKNGYPVQLWTPSLSGVHFTKRVASIELVHTDAEARRFVGFINPKTGGFFNKPNATIFYLQNGQIFKLGEEITFEGVVDAYDEKVTQVQISMDRGKTWTTYDLGDTDVSKWVNWTFRYTPETPGSYVIDVRGVTESGLVSETPARLMFNVK